MERFVVFDIETTGFSSITCDIIQFAYCEFHGGQFVKAENLYFYYDGMSWSDEAEQVHKISRDYLKQYRDDFKTNLLKMYSVLNRSNVCGHNSNHFDCPFVRNWLSRMGMGDFEFGIKQDTMVDMRPIHKRPRIKLTKLSELCGLTQESINYATNMWFGDSNIRNSHDAAYDVTATALITLKGLREGCISFGIKEVVDVPVDESSFDFVAEENNVKPMALVIFESTGRRTYPCRPNDKPGVLPLPVDTYWELPEPLPMFEPHEGVMVNLRSDGNEEWLEIVTPYVTVDSRQTDTLPLLQSLYKEK